MKKIILLFTISIIILNACTSTKKLTKTENIKIHYNKTPLTLIEDNKAEVDFTIEFPAKYFPKKYYLIITPVLISQKGDTINLLSSTLIGEKVPDNYPFIKYKEGGTFHYVDTVEINAPNQPFDLILKGSFTNETMSKKIKIQPITIAKGIIPSK